MNQIRHEYGFEIEHELTEESKQVSTGAFANIIRFIGAGAVIVSLSLFLIEGWTEGNDISRYVKLLMQTGLITGAGVFLSFVVKEVKGARVFFGLGLLSAVANFTILGALTYSKFQLDDALGNYPSMLQWQAVNLTQLLPLAAVSTCLLALLSRFSFGVFARPIAGKLTLSFFLLNLLLLVPARDTVYISLLATLAMGAAGHISLATIRDATVPMTSEIKASLAVLFLPGLIIVCRSLGLYSVDDFILLTFCSLFYFILRCLTSVNHFIASRFIFSLAVWMQYVAGLVISSLISGLLPEQIDSGYCFVFTCVLILVLFDQAKQHGHSVPDTVTAATTFSILILLLIQSMALLITDSMTISLLALASTLTMLISLQHLNRSLGGLKVAKIMTVIGVFITGIALGLRVVAAIQISAWAWMGALGIGLILLASLYERRTAIFSTGH